MNLNEFDGSTSTVVAAKDEITTYLLQSSRKNSLF